MGIWKSMNTERFALAVVLLGALVALSGSLVGPHPDDHVVQMWLEGYSKQVVAGAPVSFTLQVKSLDKVAKEYELRVLVDGFVKQSEHLSVPPAGQLSRSFSLPAAGAGQYQVKVIVYDPDLPGKDFGSQQLPYSVSYWLAVS